jgi:RHS repeat-associated protein
VAQLFFIHTDYLNTPRVITNQAAQVVWRWDQTDPFGGNPPDENPSGLGSFTCNLRLPGQYFDKETNLHYNYRRDYDSAIGRYIQSDPIGLRGGINTYAYVASDPLGFSDPEGLTKEKFIYAGCSDGQIVRCVEKCRAEGKIMQDCTQVYVQIPGVNGGKPKFKDWYCVCEEKAPATATSSFSCGPTCQKTLLVVGAIVIMICTRIPMPLP